MQAKTYIAAIYNIYAFVYVIPAVMAVG